MPKPASNRVPWAFGVATETLPQRVSRAPQRGSRNHVAKGFALIWNDTNGNKMAKQKLTLWLLNRVVDLGCSPRNFDEPIRRADRMSRSEGRRRRA
jgi:hypothetical protein